MNAFMNVYVRVLSGPALAQLKALQAQSRATAAGVGSVGQKAQWGLPFISKWGNQVQWVGRQLMYNFTLPLALAGGAATMFALENERAMVRVQKVYGDNSKQMNRVAKTEIPALREAFVALSNQFGVHQEQVIRIAGDWAAAGASGLALAKSVKLTLETMVLGELEAVDATQQLIAIQAQYGFRVDQLSKTISILNMVENQTGTTMKDLMASMARSAGVARVAGIDVEHLAAMTAALVPAAGSAANAGNALKTIISRILSPTKEAGEVMQEMGIATDRLSWQSMTGAQRIEALAKNFDKLSTSQRAHVATVLGSRWQLNRLVILLQAVNNENSYYNKALKSTSDQQKIFTQRQKELNQVLSSSPQRVQQAWVIIKNSMADVIMPLLPYIAFLAYKVAELAQKFADLSLGTQKWILAGLVFLALIGPIARYVGSFASLFGILSAVLHFATGKLLFFLVPFKLIGKAFGLFALGVKIATGAAAVSTVANMGKMTRAIVWVGALVGTLPGLVWKAMVGVGTALAGGAKLFWAFGKAVTVALSGLIVWWRMALATMAIALVAASRSMLILWAVYGKSMIGLTKVISMGIAGIWIALSRALPMITFTAIKLVGAVFAGAVTLLRNPWVLVALAILGVVYTFRDQLRAAWDAIVQYVVDAWAGVVDFFHNIVQNIVDAFWALPEGITSAFMAVLEIVQTIAMKIYEWMSYLNPFARHSPSLVDSVTAGMDVIVAQYARASTLGSVFARAAADLAKFKKLYAEGFADERKNVVKSGGNVGLFDSMLSSLKTLRPIMAAHEARVNAQQKVVDAWKSALDKANAALDVQQRKLDLLQDRLSKLQALYQSHEDAMNAYADAPIKGMTAMEDQIFANELAQKKLRLEMLKFEQVHGSIDDLRDRLSALYGDIEILRGNAAELRAAGAGSDVLGPIEAQIAAMEAQAKALETSINNNPIDKYKKQLEELELQGEILDLEKSIKFDPMIREIEKLVDAREELTFDEIVAGIKTERAAMDELQPKIDRVTKAIAAQQLVVDSLTASRDKIQIRYDNESKKLQALEDSYQKVSEVVRELESALSQMGQAASAANQKAASAASAAAKKAGGGTDSLSNARQTFRDAAGGNWPDVGGKAKIGREGGLGDQSKMIEEWTKGQIGEMTSLLDGFDMMGPLKKKWNRAWGWVKENVGPVITSLRDRIGEGFRRIGDGIQGSGFLQKVKRSFNTTWNFIKKWAERLGNLFGPDIRRIWNALVKAGRRIWNELGPELEKFKELLGPLRELWDDLWPGIKTVAKIIGGVLIVAIKIAASLFSHLLGPALDIIISVVKSVIKILRGIIEFIVGVFTGDWKLAWQGIKDIVSGLWDAIFAILKAPIDFIVGIFWALMDGIKEAWEWLKDILVGHSIIPDMVNAIFAVFGGLVRLVKWIWNNVLKPIYNWFKAVWKDYIKPAISAWWDGVKKAWDKLKKAATWIWENVLKPVWNWVKKVWTDYVKPALSAWWENVKNAWARLKGAATWIWENVLKPVWNWVKKVWTDYIKPEALAWWERLKNLWANLKRLGGWFWDNVLNPIKQKFIDAFNGIKTWFQDNKDKILQPIRSVVKSVVDAVNFVIRGINKLSNLPGLDFIDIPEITVSWAMAAGGEMPSRRVGSGFKTTGARAIVGEGKANWPEYVIPTDPTYRNRAQALLQDASYRIGMAATPLHASGGILGVPQYESGGLLGAIKSAAGKVKDWGKDGLDWMKGNLKKLASALAKPLVDRAKNFVEEHISWPPARRAAMWPINKVYDWLTVADKVYEDGAGKMTYAGAPGGPPVQDGDWERIYWRGHQFNKRTVRMIQNAERIMGQQYHITQGSWSNYSASAGTHSGGGAFDATSPATTQAQNAARMAGFAAWLRSPSQGPWPAHIHAIALGDIQASLSARNQMGAYLRGEDGLAAQGAIIRATRGGRLMRVGEAGRDEAILPLPQGWKNGLIPTSKTENSQTHIHLHGDLSFPNIKSGDDAETFIKNIALLAKD